MAIDQTVVEAMEIAKRSFPTAPRVVRVTVEDEVDSQGSDALRVTVVLPDDTRDDDLAGDNLLALRWAIHQSLDAKGIKLFPYIFYATEQELADEADERARETAS